MTSPDIYLSVIVPVYNEAERLPQTLRRLHEYFATGSFSYEILVILDGPTDNTRGVSNAMGGGIDHVKVFDRQGNRDNGFTVKGGMAKHAGRLRAIHDG